MLYREVSVGWDSVNYLKKINLFIIIYVNLNWRLLNIRKLGATSKYLVNIGI